MPVGLLSLLWLGLHVALPNMALAQYCVPVHNTTVLGLGSPTPFEKMAQEANLYEYTTTCRPANSPEFRMLIDTGEGTTIRLAQLGVRSVTLDLVAYTHLGHIDHSGGGARVIQQRGTIPLPLLAPYLPGGTGTSARGSTLSMLWSMLVYVLGDTFNRIVVLPTVPSPTIVNGTFIPSLTPTIVFTKTLASGSVINVWAVRVDHGHNVADTDHIEAVAYCIESPAGVICYSGDETLNHRSTLEDMMDQLKPSILKTNSFLASWSGIGIPPIFQNFHMRDDKTGSLGCRTNVPTILQGHNIPPIGSPNFQQDPANPTRTCDRDPQDGIPETCFVSRADYIKAFRDGEHLDKSDGYKGWMYVAKELQEVSEARLDIVNMTLVDKQASCGTLGCDVRVLQNGATVNFTQLQHQVGSSHFTLRAELDSSSPFSTLVQRVTWYVLDPFGIRELGVEEGTFEKEEKDNAAPFCIASTSTQTCKKYNNWPSLSGDWPSSGGNWTVSARASFVNSTSGIEWQGAPIVRTLWVVA